MHNAELKHSIDSSLYLHDNNDDIGNKNDIEKRNLNEFITNPYLSPYIKVRDNLCHYNGQFRVFDKKDEFYISSVSEKEFFGARAPGNELRQSSHILSHFFNATVWNEGEYEISNCYYSNIKSHIILHSWYQWMPGELYQRTVHDLWYLQQIMNIKYIKNKNYKLWILMSEGSKIYTTMLLFLEPFTNYETQSIMSSMMNHYKCKCYQKIIFLGFSHENITDNKHLFSKTYNVTNNDMIKEKINQLKIEPWFPEKNLVFKYDINGWRKKHQYKLLYQFFNNYVDQQLNKTIQDNINKWKLKMIETKTSDQLKLKHRAIMNNLNINTMNEWQFVGFYDRKLRRAWHNINDMINFCNDRYFKLKIFCYKLLFDDIDYEIIKAKDIIIRHRATDLFVGVHGSHWANALFMGYKIPINKHSKIIELLPNQGSDWATRIDTPTAMGYLFIGSNIFYTAFKLENNSMLTQAKYKQNWIHSSFKVNVKKLTKCIDYLIGYDIVNKTIQKSLLPCNNRKKNSDKENQFIFPKYFLHISKNFAIHNGYCPN